MRSTPKILILSGSIRSGSFNNRLADAFFGELANHECEVTRINLSDYSLPIYNGDDEEEKGVPENATKLASLFDTHQAMVIVGPEYNGSITPLLKNSIDWISRVKTNNGKDVSPYKNKIAAIAAASPGAMGGISTLGHLRDVLVRLGALVLSEQLALGNAGAAFDDMDQLTNERHAAMLKAQCASLVEKATWHS